MITVDGLTLHSAIVRPGSSEAGAKSEYPGLLLCHSFPGQRRPGSSFGATYPQLAERLTEQTDWVVMTMQMRGAGDSQGDFSLLGWLDDVRAAAQVLRDDEQVSDVWLAGFGTGGSLAICVAAEQEWISGVASFGSPADFSDWADNPRACLERARESGAIRNKDFPRDFDAWAGELAELKPVELIARIPPRSVLVVHGADDDVVSQMDARALADAADHRLELRVLGGGGHDLLHDPRAIAILMGWMERQTA